MINVNRPNFSSSQTMDLPTKHDEWLLWEKCVVVKHTFCIAASHYWCVSHQCHLLNQKLCTTMKNEQCKKCDTVFLRVSCYEHTNIARVHKIVADVSTKIYDSFLLQSIFTHMHCASSVVTLWWKIKVTYWLSHLWLKVWLSCLPLLITFLFVISCL